VKLVLFGAALLFLGTVLLAIAFHKQRAHHRLQQFAIFR